MSDHLTLAEAAAVRAWRYKKRLDALRADLAKLADDWTDTEDVTADVIAGEMRRLLDAHPTTPARDGGQLPTLPSATAEAKALYGLPEGVEINFTARQAGKSLSIAQQSAFIEGALFATKAMDEAEIREPALRVDAGEIHRVIAESFDYHVYEDSAARRMYFLRDAVRGVVASLGEATHD